MVAGQTDQLVVELGAKLSYNSCIRAKEENYHRDYMQRFLSVVTVITSAINYKHFISSKMMDLITFVIGISLTVTTQHCRLLFLKCRNIFKTITTTSKCNQSDIFVKNCQNAMVLKDPSKIKATCSASKKYALV